MKELKRVKSSLIQQDCYVRDCSAVFDLQSAYSGSTYTTLNEKTVNTDNGTSFEQEFVDVPYPITPESVNSYVEGSDYRRDPVAAIASAPSRENLGDITAFQDVMSMDSESAAALYAQLSERFGFGSTGSTGSTGSDDSVLEADKDVK